MPEVKPQPDDKTVWTSARARLDLVPREPGVYLMRDAAGHVIYVGKAVSLRQRLASYFTPNPRGTAHILAMIRQIADFSYLVCQNEVEAFILESNLIKRYQPFYNILLKDDHDYPYIKLTMQETYPRIQKAWRIEADREEGARYYGPYLNGDVNRAIQTLHDIFPMKTCNRVFPRDIGKERPCLNYHINRCIGPCLGDVTAAQYRAVLEQVQDFLEGRGDSVRSRLRVDMEEAAEALRFEQAAVLRDRLAALDRLLVRQTAVSGSRFDADALGLARNPVETCILRLEVRGGKITGTSTHFLSDAGEEDTELLAAFIRQYYAQARRVPPMVISPFALPDEEREELGRLLSGLAGRRVRVHHPARGPRRRIVEMAARNAAETLRRRSLMAGSTQEALDTALQLLAAFVGLAAPPARIEAFDVTNLGEADRSCSMVVFVHGRARRQAYRQFHIRGFEGIDDYRAMAEAVERRLARLDDPAFGQRPDLILVDGGTAHVSVITDLVREHGETIPVAGIVKDRRHRTRGLALADGRTIELARALGISQAEESDASLGTPCCEMTGKPADRPDTLSLDDLGREEQFRLLRLLTAIQDEAHRRAQRGGKSLARRRQLHYRLESIPGIGPARRRVLLKHFGSLKAIAAADLAALEACPGLGAKPAAAVYRHFHPETDAAAAEEN